MSSWRPGSARDDAGRPTKVLVVAANLSTSHESPWPQTSGKDATECPWSAHRQCPLPLAPVARQNPKAAVNNQHMLMA